MKALLYKEFQLCLNAQTIIFLLLSCLICIPQWPSLVGFLYCFLGIFMIFPYAIGNKDLEFTALLPVKKTDVVKGKMLFCGVLELISIVLSIPFALIKLLLINPALAADGSAYAELGVNFALYGFVFLLYAVFNSIYFPMYYKKPYKTFWPQLISLLSCSLGLTVIMVLFIAIPSWSEFINTYSGMGLLVQLIILGVGIIIYALSGFLSYRASAKSFEKVDL